MNTDSANSELPKAVILEESLIDEQLSTRYGELDLVGFWNPLEVDRVMKKGLRLHVRIEK